MANSRVIGSGLSFDAGNNAVVIADAGTYLFLWHVAGNVPQTSDLLISLESLDGTTVYALSGDDTRANNPYNTTTGSTAVALAENASVVLRNRSTGTLTLTPLSGQGGAQYTNSMTVVRVG